MKDNLNFMVGLPYLGLCNVMFMKELRAKVIKLFYRNKLLTGMHFQPSVTFASKVGGYPCGVTSGAPLNG